MPLDLLRFSRLDPIANLQRAFRIEDELAPVALERRFFRIRSGGLADDLRLRRFDDTNSVERLARHPGPNIVPSLDALPDAADGDRVVIPGPTHARVTSVSRQVTPGRPEDEAVRVGMRVTGALSPLGYLRLQRQCAMPFRRSGFECQRGRVFFPRCADVCDTGVFEMMS